MNHLYKYRFKTKQEMTISFGVFWRNKVFFNTEGYMDYLLGQEIDKKYYEFIENKQYFTVPITDILVRRDSWTIDAGKDIFVKIPIKPNYNKKILIKE